MSQKVSPTAIGAFVLGAVALIITGLLTFGSGKFLKDTETYILYFEGNAKGLNIGAPASFRGIKIGTVTDIKLVSDVSTDQVYIAVTVEIRSEVFHEIQSQPGVDRTAGEKPLPYLIDELGVRAKLAPLSLVTGQLYIEFNFFPDSPAKLYGFKSAYPELPTLPSTMEELQVTLEEMLKTVRDLPLRELVDNLVSAVDGINDLVTSQRFRETPEVLNQALVNIRDLTGKLNAQVTPLTRSLQQTSEQAGAAVADLRIMLRHEESEEVVRLAESIEDAATETRELLNQSGELVSSVDVTTLESLIQELSEAARSIRVFADYLERHPEALLRGKN